MYRVFQALPGAYIRGCPHIMSANFMWIAPYDKWLQCQLIFCWNILKVVVFHHSWSSARHHQSHPAVQLSSCIHMSGEIRWNDCKFEVKSGDSTTDQAKSGEWMAYQAKSSDPTRYQAKLRNLTISQAKSGDSTAYKVILRNWSWPVSCVVIR